MRDHIYISLTEYKKLKNAENKLDALESNGVDNWIGFDIAMQDYNNDDEVFDEN